MDENGAGFSSKDLFEGQKADIEFVQVKGLKELMGYVRFAFDSDRRTLTQLRISFKKIFNKSQTLGSSMCHLNDNPGHTVKKHS